MYSDSDLPISFYALLDKSVMNNAEYYDFFFSFDTLENKEEINYYEVFPFSVSAYIIKQNTVFNIKKNPDMAPQTDNPLLGSYDPLLKTGFIRISKENIEKSQIDEEDQPYLYLTIKKSINNNEQSEIKFNKVGLEMSAIKNSHEIPVSELSYQFGKLEINQKESLYRLKMDNSFKYINLKFSCANNNALSIKIDGGYNLKEEKEEYGRKIYSLTTKANKYSIVLVISRNSQNLDTEEYFTFQYVHSNNTYVDNYKIRNTSLEIDKTNIENQRKKGIQKLTVNISLDPVEDGQNYDISYTVKGFEKSPKHTPEKSDLSLNFVKNQYIVEYNNPKVDEKTKKLKLSLKDIPDKVDFIQVIAQIKDKEKLEYLSYDLFDISPKDGSNKTRNYTLLIVLILVFLFSIVVVLVIIVIIYFNKNKSLLEQVNKISFAGDRDNSNKNDMLINSDENDK